MSRQSPGAVIEARQLLQPAQTQLRDAGIADASLDARLLLAMALGREEAVLPHERLTDWSHTAAAGFSRLLARRCAGEPVSRIRGWREFWSLRFALSADTLDPRPDSETVVEAALAWVGGRREASLRLLDLGTGSGALLLACLSEMPGATGIGVDLSAGALATATANAAQLRLSDRVQFVEGDFADPQAGAGEFDLILCNPPYIPRRAIEQLAPEVAHFDPKRALDGGDDGLDCWRSLLPRLRRGLAPNGRAFVEIGAGQEEAVTSLARQAGLQAAGTRPDLSGTIRCLIFAG
ncbi:MAG: peptide chain release factor N(5)-glutamine methyltransferase [Pseudomonadota bacterium]|nr:peptide chain release factor N(5)-glutamine methyltransferase [Pseudomonadota bacterium]